MKSVIVRSLAAGALILLQACIETPVEQTGYNEAGSESDEDRNGNGRPSKAVDRSIPERRYASIPESGVELGMGWNSLRGEIVPNFCMDFAPVRSPGQEIEVDIHEVSDQSEIMDSLNVSAEVAVKTMFASGGAKANFARESKVSSNSTTLLLHAVVEDGVLFMGPPHAPAATRSGFPAVEPAQLFSAEKQRSGPTVLEFSPEVKAYAENPDKFRDMCGDYFVSAVFGGAELIATLTFTANSEASSQDISAAVQAQYGAISASVAAEKKNSASEQSTDFRLNFVQVGGGPGMIPMSKDGLEQKLRELSIEAHNNPKLHTMELRSYREVAGADGLVFSSKDKEFEVIADYYWLLTSLYTDLAEVLNAPQNYRTLAGFRELNSEHIKKLRNLQDDILIVNASLREIMDAYYDGRRPNDEIIAKTHHDWFARELLYMREQCPDNDCGESRYVTNEMLDQLSNLAVEEENRFRDCPASDNDWFGCVVTAFEQSVPFENPNTLRLLIPVRKTPDDAARLAKYNNINGRWSVVNDLFYSHELVQQTKRFCQRDPADNECMTNAELDTLYKLIFGYEWLVTW